MARNTRNYPKSDTESLRDTVRSLKSRVRKLTKENRDLRSENKTLLDAWVKAEDFLQEVTEGVPLEELLKYRTLPTKALRQYEQELEQELQEEFDDKEQARLKWKKWREENL